MTTLIIEDGTGVTDSNTYIDEDYAESYAESLGSDIWENNVSKHKIALINASTFIDMRFRSRFKGTKLNDNQGLLLPTTDIAISTSLKKAVAHAALTFILEGGLDLNANANNAIKRQSIGIGSGAIQETIEYFYPNPNNIFAVIDAYIDQAVPRASSRQFAVYRG